VSESVEMRQTARDREVSALRRDAILAKEESETRLRGLRQEHESVKVRYETRLRGLADELAKARKTSAGAGAGAGAGTGTGGDSAASTNDFYSFGACTRDPSIAAEQFQSQRALLNSAEKLISSGFTTHAQLDRQLWTIVNNWRAFFSNPLNKVTLTQTPTLTLTLTPTLTLILTLTPTLTLTLTLIPTYASPVPLFLSRCDV
jgi:hypothetical protein